MIEIRELIIRTKVTQKAAGSDQVQYASSAKKDTAALEELMRGLNNKNER